MPLQDGRYDYIDLDKLEQPSNQPDFQEDKKDETPNSKETFIGLLLGLGYVTFLAIIPLYIIIFIFGNPTTSAQESIFSSSAQLICAVGVLIGMFFVSRRVLKTIRQGFTLKAFGQGLKYAVLVYLIAIVVSLLDIFLFGESDTNANQSSIEDLMIAAPVLGAVFTCIVAPIIEEVIFRYYLFKPLSKKNVVLAFVVSGVAFGAIHMMSTVSSFATNGDKVALLNDLRSLPAYIIAGLCFCFVYYKTQKLSVSIFAHMIYNTVVTVVMLISIQNMPLKITNVSTQDTAITFTLNPNTASDVTIVSIELKDETGVVANMNVNQEDYQDLVFDNLTTGTTYKIVISYKYKSAANSSSTDYAEEEIETYAVARG